MTDFELGEREVEALKQIRNYYINTGEFPSVRKLSALLKYKSPRSTFLLIQKIVEKGLILRDSDGNYELKNDPSDLQSESTVDIPLIGSVACGAPILAEQNFEAMVPVSQKLVTPGNKYFFVRARGDSMNLAGINDGDFVLIRQTNTAKNGDAVVALINDEATIKQIQYEDNYVILKPNSSSKKHMPIILSSEFQIQGVVVSAIPKIF